MLKKGAEKAYWFDITRFAGAPKEAPNRDWQKDFDAGAFFSQALGLPQVDYEKLVRELRSTLPRCTAKVVVGGPSYGDKSIVGDVIEYSGRT